LDLFRISGFVISDFDSMRIIITAGGTREYLDPVRFITNASSGRMGYALARAALAAGHKVTLISAPVALKAPAGVTLVEVVSAADMYSAVRKCFSSCDCLIMAAAVSDYAPAAPSKTKLKKTSSLLTIRLKPTVDILKWAGAHKRRQLVVGFALEDKDVLRRAEEKLRKKHADMIVANTPSAIGRATSSLAVKTPAAPWLFLKDAAKSATARKLISIIAQLRVR
jgi:phosphopantothenoylcysteine decarboxylase / phosphopantothenate---cysteine ligase